jgi:hypothetical protein
MKALLQGLNDGADPREPIRHSSVPGSFDLRAKDGVGSFVSPDGPLRIVVSGAFVSTVKERIAGVLSVLWRLRARTTKA